MFKNYVNIKEVKNSKNDWNAKLLKMNWCKLKNKIYN